MCMTKNSATLQREMLLESYRQEGSTTPSGFPQDERANSLKRLRKKILSRCKTNTCISFALLTEEVPREETDPFTFYQFVRELLARHTCPADVDPGVECSLRWVCSDSPQIGKRI